MNTTDSVLMYDASGEQVQCWNYEHKPGEEVMPQVLSLATTMENPDLPSLERSIEVMIRRHESLRTFFRVVDGTIRQCIIPYDKTLFSPAHHDMRDEKDARKLISDILDLNIGFYKQLDRPPLLRSFIFRLTGDSYYICLLVHHIISDDWSRALMYKEMNTLYQSLRNGDAVEEKPGKIQLKDYALWQRKWFKDNGEAACMYWANKLSALGDDAAGGRGDTGLAINSRQEHLDILNNTIARESDCLIGLPLYTRLKELSIRANSKILAILVASLKLLFFSLMGKKKTLIAMPVASRSGPGTESIIGYLVGGIYQYLEVREEMTIIDFIEDVFVDFLQSNMNLIYNHAEMRLDETNIRIHCDIYVNFLNNEMVRSYTPDAKTDAGHRDAPFAAYYSLSYFVSEYQDGLVCTWRYNPRMYSQTVMDQLKEAHEKILHIMCRSPESAIGNILHASAANRNNSAL